MNKNNKELILATELIKTATNITEWFRKKGFDSFQKKDKSPVTIADYASQLFIIDKLRKKFPEDQIIAEESIHSNITDNNKKVILQCYNSLDLEIVENIEDIINYRGSSSTRQWTIDPIDGTLGFQSDLSYAVGIGFMVDSNIEIASIGIPNYNEEGKAIFIAQRGKGTQASYGNKDFIKVSVNKNSDFKNILMCRSLHYNKPWVDKFSQLAKITNFITMDSMAKFCLISDGTADLYIKPMDLKRSFSWDFLPGTLIVKEAGGVVTDLKGESIKFKNEKCLISSPGLVASNGIIHEKVLSYLRNMNFN